MKHIEANIKDAKIIKDGRIQILLDFPVDELSKDRELIHILSRGEVDIKLRPHDDSLPF